MTTFTPINRVDDTASGTSSGALGGGGGGDDGRKKPNRNNEGPLGHKDNTDDFDITTAGKSSDLQIFRSLTNVFRLNRNLRGLVIHSPVHAQRLNL